MPAGSVVVVISRTGILTAIVRPPFAVTAFGVSESVTETVKLAVLAEVPVGVPESAPVAALIESHDGLPVRLQEYGATPPVTLMVAL